jgi:hypothetical protein
VRHPSAASRSRPILRAAPASLGVAAFLCAGAGSAIELPSGSDPVVAELVEACSATIETGAGSLYGELADAGWFQYPPSSDEQAYLHYDRVSGDRTFDGVGTARLTATTEAYPGMEIGSCAIAIDAPERQLRLSDIGKAPGLIGEASDENGSSRVWRDDAGHLFIQAMQLDGLDIMRLHMTVIREGDDVGF